MQHLLTIGITRFLFSSLFAENANLEEIWGEKNYEYIEKGILINALGSTTEILLI